jgi:hypothetical protein
MTSGRAWLGHLLAGVLLLVFFVQALTATLEHAATSDEPPHIAAGLSYLRTGEFKVNLQHPPLLKQLAALPLVAAGVRLPMTPEAWDALGPRADPGFQWPLGRAVLLANGSERVMVLARLPMILLATLLGWVVYAWGRQLLGSTAALGALALFAFDPVLLGHGPLVTTDVGCTAFAVLFLFALWRYFERRTPGRLALAGLALGAALGAKFSMLFLLPIALVLMVIATLTIPPRVEAPAARLPDPFAPADLRRRAARGGLALALMAAVAAVVVHAIYASPRALGLYVEGLGLVNADHDPGYWAYMAGGFQPRFWSYYVVAYLLKEPLPSILLATAGTWLVLRRGAARPLDRAFLLLPPLTFVAAATVFSHNLGVRYVIPALPLLHLLGGVAAAKLLHGPRWRRGVAVGLASWLVAGSAGIYPDHLTYFNELACVSTERPRLGVAGGTACGPLLLDDSNVDWGQGLLQLRAWLEAHPSPGPTRLAYFGSLRPEDYGLRYQPVALQELLQPPPPGRTVVSAHLLARAHGLFATTSGFGPENWPRHLLPIAVVGHAYYVYDVP